MSSKKAHFTFRWKIEWSEFEELSTKDITKYFVTAFKNVVFHWRVVLSCKDAKTLANNYSFYIFYDYGPIAELKGLDYSVDVMQFDEYVVKLLSGKADFQLGTYNGWPNFDKKDVKSFQRRYGLMVSESLYYRVTLKIPISIFSFFEISPIPDSASWSRAFFQQIEDPEKALFWNVKLISNEGTVFYCHEVVLGYQSEVLAAMFRYPKSKNVKKGEYKFPALSTSILRALLEFLYTGQVSLIDLSTNEILEVADTAEQYCLKILKQMCLAHLWKRVVQKLEDCFSVIRFSDLHDDWKHLNHRAMDVLTENFENWGLHSMNLKKRFGGGEDGARLRKEFTLYGYRRLLPYFLEKRDFGSDSSESYSETDSEDE